MTAATTFNAIVKFGLQGAQKIDGATGKVKRLGTSLDTTKKKAVGLSVALGAVGGALKGLVAGFGVFAIVGGIAKTTAELEKQTKSLEVLTGSASKARNIVSELQELGAKTPFQTSELIDTAKRLKAFGFETENIIDLTKRLADVSGATGAELKGIATAFGQVQAKGRLQGEELLQLQERGIGLQEQLKEQLGLTGDEFTKALEKGEISAEEVNKALITLTNTGGKYANGAIAQSGTLSGKFSTLLDGINRLAQGLGETLAPAFKVVLEVAINTVNTIIAAVNRVNKFLDVGTQNKIDSRQERLSRLLGRGDDFETDKQLRRGLNPPIQSFETRKQAVDRTLGELQDLVGKTLKPVKADIKVTNLPKPTGDIDKGGGSGRASAKQVKNEREIQTITAEVARIRRNIATLQREGNELEVLNLQTKLKEIELAKQLEEQQISQILFDTRLFELKEEFGRRTSEILDRQTEDRKQASQEFFTQIFQQGEALDDYINKAAEIERLKNPINGVTEALNELAGGFDFAFQGAKQFAEAGIDGISDAITTLVVDGTLNFREFAVNLLKDLARILIQSIAVKAILQAIGFGVPAQKVNFPLIKGDLGIPGLANGGIVTRPTTALIGEGGMAEAVVPLPNGRSIPVDMQGGAKTVNIGDVNISVENTGSDLTPEAQKSLASQVQGLVIDQIVNERRAGGLLT